MLILSNIRLFNNLKLKLNPRNQFFHLAENSKNLEIILPRGFDVWSTAISLGSLIGLKVFDQFISNLGCATCRRIKLSREIAVDSNIINNKTIEIKSNARSPIELQSSIILPVTPDVRPEERIEPVLSIY